MTDSEDDGLLFGDITDVDEPSNKSQDPENGKTGTAYPQHLTKVGMDSDSSNESDDLHRMHSHSNDAVQIKRKRSLKRDKSKKRIKDIDYGSSHDQIITNNNTTTSTTNDHGNVGGENNETDPDHEHEEMVEIDPSSPIHSNSNIMNAGSSNLNLKKKSKRSLSGFSLNGKKSHKNHHKISDKDSDEEDYDEHEDEDDHIPTPKGESYGERMKYIFMKLKKNGHLISMILTLIVIITLFGCFSGDLAAIIVFIVCYLIYLVECFVNKSWKEMNNEETADATVKLLGKLLFINLFKTNHIQKICTNHKLYTM